MIDYGVGLSIQVDLILLMLQLGMYMINWLWSWNFCCVFVVLCLVKFEYIIVTYRAYDRAAIKFRGVEADINFNLGDYEEDMKRVWTLLKDLLVGLYDRWLMIY